MKLILSRVLLVIAVVCLVCFCSFTVSRTAISTESSSTVCRVGLTFSPWLTIESHSGNAGGSFHSGMDVHLFSWSSVSLVLAIALWLIYRQLKPESLHTAAPSQSFVVAASASPGPPSSSSSSPRPDIIDEPIERNTATQPEVAIAEQRTHQVRAAGWTATFAAFFAAVALSQEPTWPVAVGVVAIAAMVTVVCYTVLKRQ
jgi:hypothetical protein